MFNIKTLTNLLTWSNSSVEDEFNTWKLWQNSQPLSHYDKCDIFTYYLSKRQQFQIPKNTRVMKENGIYYKYCFGDFSCLIVNTNINNNVEDIVKYISLLLDIYDTCKGYSRMITKDPNGINLLRDIIQDKSLNPLKSFDFKDILYPFHEIHAHTVAQYSLSTLIMRIVLDYISQIFREFHYDIEVSVCKRIFDNRTFGQIAEEKSSEEDTKRSTPLNIMIRKSDTSFKSYSWSHNIDNYQCNNCNCKKIW